MPMKPHAGYDRDILLKELKKAFAESVAESQEDRIFEAIAAVICMNNRELGEDMKRVIV